MLGPLPPGARLPTNAAGLAARRLVRRLFERDAGMSEIALELDDRSYSVVGTIAPELSLAVLSFVETTERDRRERAQREFVTNAAHELRTPLAGVIAATDALQAGAKRDPAARDRLLELLSREAARLERLVNALLLLARAEAGSDPPRLAPVNLGSFLPALAREVSPAPGVRLRVSAAETAVLANEDLLAQALLNLLSNAVAHTRTGVIVLAATPRVDDVAVIVADSGVGMSARESRKSVERFYRGASGGFGLGLPIADRAARVMGGRLEVASRRSVGTIAAIFLPRAS